MVNSVIIIRIRYVTIYLFYVHIFIHLSAILSKIGSLECVCNQIVIAMETEFPEETAQLFSSLEEIQLEVNLIHNQQNEGQNSLLFP